MGTAVDDLLVAYDRQVRVWIPTWATVERDGPLLRVLDLDEGVFITYTDLAGTDGADLDALIARQRGDRPTEWKLHGHDLPADLGDRLRTAGFVAEPTETVMAGPAGPLAETLPVVPDGVRLREVSSRADLDRAGAVRPDLADRLSPELTNDPQSVTVVVAEAGDEVVAVGWVRYLAGTGFATLWGGTTAPAWRRRGIYQALVVYRARLASARGFAFLQVDARDTSRPILARMGLRPLTATTPYVYTP